MKAAEIEIIREQEFEKFAGLKHGECIVIGRRKKGKKKKMLVVALQETREMRT